MTAMVRAQSLRGYRELVNDLGGNPNRLLRKAGVDPGAPDHLTDFISFESLIDLLEHSAADLNCPDFGLRLAERQDIGILGPWRWPCATRARSATPCTAPRGTSRSITPLSPSASVLVIVAAKPVWSLGSWSNTPPGGRKPPSTGSASPGAS